MTKKRRVSAKQRLELVQRAFRILNAEDVDNRSQLDYLLFADAVGHALYDDLTPANTPQGTE